MRRWKGGLTIAMEETFNGARTGLTMLFAYLNTVARETGIERAIALDTQMRRAMGTAQGKMVREQAGVDGIDAQRASQLLPGAIEQGCGIPLPCRLHQLHGCDGQAAQPRPQVRVEKVPVCAG